MPEVALLEGPLDGGFGPNLLSAIGSRGMRRAGYVEDELVACGEAWSYVPVGALGADGRWDVRPKDQAPYRTRVLVRRPADAASCSGTVVVEWLNVSAGLDSCPDWTYLADEIFRQGHVWVGVSAQQVGVHGGASYVGLPDSGGLVGVDPERYGSLVHPGDAYSFDLFSQIGRAFADGEGVTRVLAIGESQSAFRLAGYANAVHRSAGVFAGFLIHSRGGYAADLSEGTRLTSTSLPIAIVRDDLDVPVLMVQDEGDLLPPLGFLPARQPDHERFRLWEIAGSAHADAFQLGGGPEAMHCTHLINDGAQHLVVKAALRHLDRWAGGGRPPPAAARITAFAGDDARARIVRDGWGNALGGVRSPFVDVPVAALSGESAGCGSQMCLLFGTTTPFPADRLVELYGDHARYVEVFAASFHDMVELGFALADDEDRALATARDHERWFTDPR